MTKNKLTYKKINLKVLALNSEDALKILGDLIGHNTSVTLMFKESENYQKFDRYRVYDISIAICPNFL